MFSNVLSNDIFFDIFFNCFFIENSSVSIKIRNSGMNIVVGKVVILLNKLVSGVVSVINGCW